MSTERHITHGDVRKCIAGDHSECSGPLPREKMSAEELAEGILCDYGRTFPEDSAKFKLQVAIVAKRIEAYAQRERERADRAEAELKKEAQLSKELADECLGYGIERARLKAEVERLRKELAEAKEMVSLAIRGLLPPLPPLMAGERNEHCPAQAESQESSHDPSVESKHLRNRG